MTDFSFTLLELPKFNKEIHELSNMVEIFSALLSDGFKARMGL
jgi:hypothetical protein